MGDGDNAHGGILASRRALITGSTRGIGRAISQRFLQEGARVVVNSEVEDEDAAEMRAWFAHQGHCPAYIAADLSRPEDCERLVAEAAAHLGGLDLLVNCAAFVDTFRLLESSDAFIDRVIATNLRGPILTCRAALPHLARAATGGHPACIINVGSGSGIQGHALLTVYSASKGGLHAFTRALARELGGTGVRCNAVVPGWIENAVPQDKSDTSWGAWLDYAGHCPLGRAGTVEEVAAVVAQLAGHDSSYVNGQLIVVDGGAM
jgi:NAD(P)-dependent dehydrogenase (short-subunit alcohol dehydrogenase family)